MKSIELNLTTLDSTKPLSIEQLQCFQMAYSYLQSGIIFHQASHGRFTHTETVTRNRARTRIKLGI